MMAEGAARHWRALLRRELLEYRNSLLVTPVVIALFLALAMLASVMLANRISAMGDAIMDVILEDHAQTMDISIHIEDGKTEIQRNYRIERETGPVDESEWDFAREWDFKPGTGSNGELAEKDASASEPEQDNSLNLMLNAAHLSFLLVLFLVTAHYLLGSLFNDRRDRSILFFKSMPVSDRDEVLTKFAVAMVIAPGIYIAVSMVTQFISTGLAMLLVWRMGREPVEVVLGNIQFVPMVFGQLSGWLLTMLWVAPVYAWLLLASAAARKSPFLAAIGPVVALAVVERVVFGTRFVSDALWQHMPHANGESTVGFYLHSPEWASQDLLSIALGLVFAAAALAATIYLRRSRFDA